MNLKEIKQRILSVKGTQKITSAMKLVSAAKLRRAQARIEGMRPYQLKLDAMLSSFLGSSESVESPYIAEREAKRVVVIPIASDSSLCGSFNSNIIRLANEVLDGYMAQDADVEIMPVGRKMRDAIRKRGLDCDETLMEYCAAAEYSPVANMAYTLMERFAKGEIDKVELVYTHFHSAAKQIPVRETFLPIDITGMKGNKQLTDDMFIVEPSNDELVSALLPKVIALRLYTAMLDSTAAEHAARMLAMQIATDNADDLISELVLEYNKGRQQAITNELLDIVSGSVNG